MNRFVFAKQEVSAVDELLDSIIDRYDHPEDREFQSRAALYAQEMPRRVREEIHRFRLTEPRGALLVVSGYPVDDQALGDTPGHWSDEIGSTQELRLEYLLLLLGSLLGEPIAWSTQQDGAVVHNIVPIQGHEKEQMGSGSEEDLWWHTEDAFHEYRGDYLGMLCMRNPDNVPTTFASLEDLDLDPHHLERLFEPHFTIRPDESHLLKNRGDENGFDSGLAGAYQRIESMTAEPEKISVLFGDPAAPYSRLDPYFMDPPQDPKARAALSELIRWIDTRLEDLVLAPGDFAFIDNFQAVHGRRPFKARYDGRDRWLKRINVARDLRKSRVVRAQAGDRVLY